MLSASSPTFASSAEGAHDEPVREGRGAACDGVRRPVGYWDAPQAGASPPLNVISIRSREHLAPLARGAWWLLCGLRQQHDSLM